jgi:tetratricopeptide (TPR) repeat protein
MLFLLQAWRRAAGALAELGLYERAIEYYGVAMRLDTSLEELLHPTIARLRLLGRLADIP